RRGYRASRDAARDAPGPRSVDRTEALLKLRLPPVRQEAERVGGDGGVERDVAAREALLERAVLARVHDVGATTDVLATDEDLRDGRGARLHAERAADVGAALVGLVLDRVEIDREV